MLCLKYRTWVKRALTRRRRKNVAQNVVSAALFFNHPPHLKTTTKKKINNLHLFHRTPKKERNKKALFLPKNRLKIQTRKSEMTHEDPYLNRLKYQTMTMMMTTTALIANRNTITTAVVTTAFAHQVRNQHHKVRDLMFPSSIISSPLSSASMNVIRTMLPTATMTITTFSLQDRHFRIQAQEVVSPILSESGSTRAWMRRLLHMVLMQ
mmetsp:Transcript_27557/g.66235  ORF Transcript_27557/g.66235 Transcript_27557/m.66235 type:complete len:209 (-) Transcript_27557:157-783(-)